MVTRDTLLAIALLTVIIGFLFGFLLGLACHDDSRRATEREAELRAQRDALHQTQLLNLAFWQARAQMWDEALQPQGRPDQ